MALQAGEIEDGGRVRLEARATALAVTGCDREAGRRRGCEITQACECAFDSRLWMLSCSKIYSGLYHHPVDKRAVVIARVRCTGCWHVAGQTS